MPDDKGRYTKVVGSYGKEILFDKLTPIAE